MKSKSHFQMNNTFNGLTEFFKKDSSGDIIGNYGSKIQLDTSGRGFTIFRSDGSSEHFYPDAYNGGFMGSHGTHVDYGPNNNLGFRPFTNGATYNPLEGLFSGVGGIFLLLSTLGCFIDALIAIKLTAIPGLILVMVGIVFINIFSSKYKSFEQEVFNMAQVFFFGGVYLLASLIMKEYGGTYAADRGVFSLVGLLVLGCVIEIILINKLILSFGNVLYCFGLFYAILCALFYNKPELPAIIGPPIVIVLIIAFISLIQILRYNV